MRHWFVVVLALHHLTSTQDAAAHRVVSGTGCVVHSTRPATACLRETSLLSSKSKTSVSVIYLFCPVHGRRCRQYHPSVSHKLDILLCCRGSTAFQEYIKAPDGCGRTLGLDPLLIDFATTITPATLAAFVWPSTCARLGGHRSTGFMEPSYTRKAWLVAGCISCCESRALGSTRITTGVRVFLGGSAKNAYSKHTAYPTRPITMPQSDRQPAGGKHTCFQPCKHPCLPLQLGRHTWELPVLYMQHLFVTHAKSRPCSTQRGTATQKHLASQPLLV